MVTSGTHGFLDVFPRCRFGVETGGTVTGWPAKGGYYILRCSVAELEYLGLDRFQPVNKSDNPQKEELWCTKIRNLGAKWYGDPYEHMEAKTRGVETPHLSLGWPSDGGAWALQTTKVEGIRKGLGRINNVFTMEER
ncbi:hypothetical protein LB507_001423 [Fusarium sp. FIESC RH6]|nr:hypothetical protein LB507_001423 [Fusarium sp. FIESC RH6]